MPNSPAPTPRLRRRVAVLLSWHTARTYLGIAQFAREAGWVLDTHISHDSSAPEWFWPPDGVIFLEGAPWTERLLKESNVPAVQLGGREFPGYPQMRFDDVETGRVAARYFLSRGLRSFAFFCNRLNNPTAELRHLGVDRELASQKLHSEVFEWHKAREKSPRGPLQAAVEWLRELPRPVALIAENDDIALLAEDAALTAGLTVPEDVAVLGCTNDELVCDFAPIPISSVNLDFELRAYRAAQLLQRVLDGDPEAARTRVLVPPVGVVERQSTDILASRTPSLAKAISFIRQNYQRGQVGAYEVAQASGLSISGLNKAFRRELGRGVAEEIRQLRLMRARTLLSSTQLSLTDVANQSGFTSPLHFRRVFLREHGKSPSDWRAEATGRK